MSTVRKRVGAENEPPTRPLVNERRIRGTVRRLFRNSAEEILAELFQNSQRAGAREVAITTREGGFTYEDDGSGLEGVDGFYRMLALAETGFENAVAEAQDPCGIGLHALLAHDRVTWVTFESGALSLRIHAPSWWADTEYAERWESRLAALLFPVRGLRITVECEGRLLEQVRAALRSRDTYPGASPAQGYEGLLDILLDGEQVPTRLPAWAEIERPLAEAEFEGNRLLVGFGGRSSVLWYGQLVKLRFGGAAGEFALRLEVRTGRPLVPRSPSRAGVVEDARYRRLVRRAEDIIFEAVSENPMPAPELVSALYRLDRDRAVREARVFTARRLDLPSRPTSVYSAAAESGREEVFRYDAPPLLLEEGVTVSEAGSRRECPFGAASFAADTGPAYLLSEGNRSRLARKRLWWRPGPERDDFGREPGLWGLGEQDREPSVWRPVTSPAVFAVAAPSPFSVDEADWLLAARDPDGFLASSARVAFDPAYESRSVDELAAHFDESVKRLRRRLAGNALPPAYTHWDLRERMPTPASPVVSVELHYEGASEAPRAVTVTNAAGERVRMRIL